MGKVHREIAMRIGLNILAVTLWLAYVALTIWPPQPEFGMGAGNGMVVEWSSTQHGWPVMFLERTTTKEFDAPGEPSFLSEWCLNGLLTDVLFVITIGAVVAGVVQATRYSQFRWAVAGLGLLIAAVVVAAISQFGLI
jgi:hypothetical protein